VEIRRRILNSSDRRAEGFALSPIVSPERSPIAWCPRFTPLLGVNLGEASPGWRAHRYVCCKTWNEAESQSFSLHARVS